MGDVRDFFLGKAYWSYITVSVTVWPSAQICRLLEHCPGNSQQLNHKKRVSYMQHPLLYSVISNKSWSPIRSSASDGLVRFCEEYFLVVLGNRKKGENQYSDFLMSLAWLVLGGRWKFDYPLQVMDVWLTCGDAQSIASLICTLLDWQAPRQLLWGERSDQQS